MGYSFLNFVNSKSIKPFYEEMNDKKWEKFNSDKVCKISYARIQGRAELERHFKGSSVMSQNVDSFHPGRQSASVYHQKHRRTGQSSEK